VPAAMLRRDSIKAAELFVLRHENAVLRRQIAGPLRYETAERLCFAALSLLIPRSLSGAKSRTNPVTCHSGTMNLTGQLARTRPPPDATGVSTNAAATATSPHRAHSVGGHGHWPHRQQQPHRARGEQHPDTAGAVENLAAATAAPPRSRTARRPRPGSRACLENLQGRRPEHPSDDQDVHATGKVTHAHPRF
jgi:putative transposase